MVFKLSSHDINVDTLRPTQSLALLTHKAFFWVWSLHVFLVSLLLSECPSQRERSTIKLTLGVDESMNVDGSLPYT